MPDFEMAKASIDAIRSLTPREIATLRVGLAMLAAEPLGSELLEAARAHADAAEILSDLDIEALIYELATCRKVTVCGSNV
jgi:hypothetical protein